MSPISLGTLITREARQRPTFEIHAARLALLTKTERALVLSLKKGHSNKELAAEFGKSEATVRHQVSSILCKARVPSRGRLIALLHEGGLP